MAFQLTRRTRTVMLMVAMGSESGFWTCRPGLALAGRAVDALADPDGAIDELAERVEVDVIEALDVQAALSGLVRAQARQHRLMPVCELADEVDDQMLTAR